MAAKEAPIQKFLQPLALVILFIGAAVSLFFMFRAGRNQSSLILIGLFTGWVLSPFVGLFILARKLGHRSNPVSSSICWLTIMISIISIISYSGIFLPSGTKNAFIFLVTPLAAWVFIAVIFIIVKIKHRPD